MHGIRRLSPLLAASALLLVTLGPMPIARAARVRRAAFDVEHEGPARLLWRALRGVHISSEQREQIDKLRIAARTRHGSARVRADELAETLAAQVEGARVNRVSLRAPVDALVAEWKLTDPADRSDLERLHSILDAEQRERLTRMARAFLARRGQPRRLAARLPADLELTVAQRARIRDALRRPAGRRAGLAMRAARARVARFLAAFKSAHFVVSEVEPPIDTRRLARAMSTRFARRLDAVLPVLTVGQRVLLARHIREGGGRPARPVQRRAS